MPRANIVRAIAVEHTPRVMQMEGIFDVAPSQRAEQTWSVNLPFKEQDWNIGLIVGASGTGKTTVARDIFKANVIDHFDWSDTRSILDDFPPEMGIKDITELLSSVGFSSPPLWVKPFRVLSTGEQFRVFVARVLAEQKDLAVVDEFTSVVDWTVAQIGSCAVAKAVRRRNQKLVAVSCHYDIIDWLCPDWIYQPATNEFCWRSQRQRPPIELTIRRVHHSAWEVFRRYHYLDQHFNKSARLFVAFWHDRPVAMQAVICCPHPHVKNLYRGHRAVCLPDYQGVGIGNALITYVASAYRGVGARIISTTSNPALYHQRSKSPDWRLNQSMRLHGALGKSSILRSAGYKPVVNRLMSSWEYIGVAMSEPDARALIYG